MAELGAAEGRVHFAFNQRRLTCGFFFFFLSSAAVNL